MSKDLKNMFSLTGRKALVIGGAGGIGGAIARGLACAGGRIVSGGCAYRWRRWRILNVRAHSRAPAQTWQRGGGSE